MTKATSNLQVFSTKTLLEFRKDQGIPGKVWSMLARFNGESFCASLSLAFLFVSSPLVLDSLSSMPRSTPLESSTDDGPTIFILFLLSMLSFFDFPFSMSSSFLLSLLPLLFIGLLVGLFFPLFCSSFVCFGFSSSFFFVSSRFRLCCSLTYFPFISSLSTPATCNASSCPESSCSFFDCVWSRGAWLSVSGLVNSRSRTYLLRVGLMDSL
mmetsp:Transcript_38597/g.43226  ORF Transcript_38597/g.43226 Transcript_38597/m.43226 type:complete len:211 (-) Transcript_38597:197-829(-)